MDIDTQAQAENLVQNEIIEKSDHDFIVLANQTEEHKFGWVVYYTTKGYAETKDPSLLVPGVGPIVVERSGRWMQLTTSGDPRAKIEEYEREWSLKQSKK